jgi:hypothetical protein
VQAPSSTTAKQSLNHSQQHSKDRLKQIMVVGGVASDDEIAKIKRGNSIKGLIKK